MDNHWSKSAADLRIFKQAGEILGQTWDNYNRPTFVDIIQNFDAFGDMGFDLLTVKIASNGQMSEHWDRLSGEEIRDGTWKEISPGEWENEKGWCTFWDEDDEKESLAWNSRKEVSKSERSICESSAIILTADRSKSCCSSSVASKSHPPKT